jgi:hypothetical protein
MNLDEKELERRVDNMTEEEKDHFKASIHVLARCYGEDAHSAVLIIRDGSPLSQVVQFNCNDLDATKMVHGAARYYDFINVADAPPKESFN